MRFCEISIGEMREILKPEDGWNDSGMDQVREIVLDQSVPEKPEIIIRVYTSIHKISQMSRSIGSDAIRVCAVDLKNRRGYIKSRKVLRVNGWRMNLLTAIGTITKQVQERIKRETVTNPLITGPGKQLESSSLVNFLWAKCGSNEYSAEASTLDANKERRAKNLCPQCNGIYSKRHLTKTIVSNEDREVQGWEFKHECGTKLVVFND
jgi:hypothetical protein